MHPLLTLNIIVILVFIGVFLHAIWWTTLSNHLPSLFRQLFASLSSLLNPWGKGQ